MNDYGFIPNMDDEDEYIANMTHDYHGDGDIDEKDKKDVKILDLLDPREPRVSKLERRERAAICRGCDKLNRMSICEICNCFMPTKSWLKNAECPLHKW